MAYSKAEVEKLMEDFARQCDELKARIRQTNVEAREEWSKVELKFQQLKTDLSPIRSDPEETISAPLELAIDEIKDGYTRIRQMM